MNTLEIFFTILRASWVGGVAILMLLLIRRVVGRSLTPAWRCWLWLPVALLFVLPRLPDVGLHRQPAVLPTSTHEATEPVTVRATLETIPPSPLPTQAAASSLTSWDWAALLWVSGAACLLVVWLAAYVSLLRRVHRGRVSTPDSLRELFTLCAQEVGLRRLPRLVVSDAMDSPAVAGLLRPGVLVPQSLPTLLDEGELRLVLLHELGHLKRRDLWFHWLSALLLAVHWFNPLVWLAARLFRADREAACDATVLATRREDARGVYGDTLLKLQSHFTPAFPFRPMVGVLGGTDLLRQRILDIAHHGRGSRWAGRAAWLLTFGISGGIALLAGKPPVAEKNTVLVAGKQPDSSSEDAAAKVQKETLRRIDALAGVVEKQVYISTKIVSIANPDEITVLADKGSDPKDPALPNFITLFKPPTGDQAAVQPGIFTIAGVFTDPQFQVIIRALNQKRGVDLLSAPSITTRSGLNAIVELVKKVRYPTEFKPGENGQPAQVLNTAERPVGWSLGVEPLILSDGMTMDLNITVENSAFEKWEDYGPGVKQPVFHTNKITTSVTIWDGQTVCLGGETFVHGPESFNKMDPLNPAAAQRRHVLVFVTPKIIDPSGRPGPWKEGDNKGIVIPEVSLQDVTVADAVSQIYELARKHDGRKKGLNLMLSQADAGALRVTLNATDMKISDLLSLLAKLAHLNLEVDGNAVLLVPQEKVKSNPTPQQPARSLQKISFTQGPRSFLENDNIEILEVYSTSPKLEPGDTVIVKGRSHLASHSAAYLDLYTTHSESEGTGEFEQSQRKELRKGGTDMFELSCTIRHQGFLHVSYYDLEKSQSFGGIYFGTPAQMDEATAKMKW